MPQATAPSKAAPNRPRVATAQEQARLMHTALDRLFPGLWIYMVNAAKTATCKESCVHPHAIGCFLSHGRPASGSAGSKI
eukprot:5438748-Amphidinium_carterae.1